MKWFIASDIHGSALYCEKMLKALSAEKADQFVLLGDILYHGPRNALPEGYDPKATAEMLNGLSKKPLCVRGNCDSEVDGMVLSFPVSADYALFCDGGVSVFATHGHLFNTQSPPTAGSWSVLLCGHTHVPALESCGKFVYINPGSVSIPKGGSERGYIIFENGVFVRKTLNGEICKSFDARNFNADT